MKEQNKEQVAEVKTSPAKKGRPANKHYVNENSIREQIALSKESGRVTEDLGRMIQLTTDRIATQNKYRSYSYLSEMKAEACYQSVKGILKFDLTKINDKGQKSSSFSYLTQIINNAFKQILKKEKRSREIKDKAIGAALEDYSDMEIDFEPIKKKREKMMLDARFEEEEENQQFKF